MKTQSSWHAWVEEGTATLYERLAAAIESDIRNGLLPPGTRLPAHRQLAQQLQIAVGTVTRAYLHLEQQGLVQGQHGRGTFVATSDQPGAPALSGRSSASGGAVELLDLSLNVPPPLIAAEKLATTLAQLPDARVSDCLCTESSMRGHDDDHDR
ncbi:GntR family transcriptional regulator [Auritidibacter ignavus]|uniref:GntR family transcriptional regulator n=1 Tax=Auritidibacter ignavus TaxID=678932 RepID=UPI003CC55EE6